MNIETMLDLKYQDLTLEKLPKDRAELERLRIGLLDYKLATDRELSERKLTLQAASRRAAATHRYSDPKWFQATQEIVARLGRESQRVQILIGEVARLIRQHNGSLRSYPDAFVELARALLPQDDFERISNAARRVSSRSTLESSPC